MLRLSNTTISAPDKGGQAMPTYEYACKECGHTFTIRLHIEEHDKKRPKCPKCGSRKLEHLYSAFFAKTAKKS
jgi:putative FmdB family regulatory protein